jgi:hypothetical protein
MVDKTALGEEILFSKHVISTGFNWELRSPSRTKIDIERLATAEPYIYFILISHLSGSHLVCPRFTRSVPRSFDKNIISSKKKFLKQGNC